jgi:hypothetical protein
MTKSQIKSLAAIQKHNKLTLRHNQSPKNSDIKSYKDSNGQEATWATWSAQYKIPGMAYNLDEIHRFYNKLRNRPPHNQGMSDSHYEIILNRYIKELEA